MSKHRVYIKAEVEASSGTEAARKLVERIANQWEEGKTSTKVWVAAPVNDYPVGVTRIEEKLYTGVTQHRESKRIARCTVRALDSVLARRDLEEFGEVLWITEGQIE